MKNSIYKYLVILTIFTSCSKEFTELSPENFLNAQEFYKTKDDFNSAVIAAYAKLQTHVSLYFELEYRSDNLNILAPTAGTQDRFDLNEFKETSANGIVQDAWRIYYNQIFRCNVITDNISGANFDLKDQYEAEARFLRALTYFNIVRLWGDAPLVLSQVSPEDALSIVRSPVSMVYEAIEADLVFAAANLPASSSSFGRATSGAAKSLLGKVYLTEKKYAEAVSILNEVVGQYTLLLNVKEVFDTNNKLNNEIIFSIRFDKELSGENHGLWLNVSDVSTSDMSSKLIGAYDALDPRKFLAEYQPNGNLFAPGKFLDEESTSTRRFGNDYILLRYADVLLMIAEAQNEIGYQSSGVAFNYLNDIRERAGLTALTPTEVPNQSTFRDVILNERFLEFPYEGQRWFDLTRTHTAKAEMALLGKTVQSHQLLWPIPQAEIEKVNNPDILGQNPGY
jgi:hypothetical protein